MARKSQARVSASELTTQRTADLGDWRGEPLAPDRRVDQGGGPGVIEERERKKPSKRARVAVWAHDGGNFNGEGYKNHVRLTFAKGASLKDPKGLFNASLEGNALRAIVIHEGDTVHDGALKALIREAVALNEAAASKKRK